MMYNVQQIEAAMINLVSWQQKLTDDGIQITEFTTAPTSGRWFNAVHSLLTNVENIWSAAPKYEDVFANDDDEEITQAYNDWLMRETKLGITEAIDRWIGAKIKVKTAGNLLEDDTLFNNTSSFSDLQTSENKFVGHRITPEKSKSLLISIKSIGVQFDTNQVITIRLFKANQKTVQQTQVITYTGNGSVQWVDVDWPIKGEGSYWIGYYQGDVTGSAINGVYNYNYGASGWEKFPSAKYFNVTAFSVNATGAELWDVKNDVYTLGTNYGLNLKFDVRCDYTDFILDQRSLFAKYIQLVVGMRILEIMAFNPNSRINRNELNMSKNDILYELEGETQGRKGRLRLLHDNALEEITFDASRIDQVCLPCRKRKIRFSTLG